MLAFLCLWSLQWFFSWLVATTLGTSNMLTVHFWHLWMLGFNTPWHWVCVNTASLQACHRSETLWNRVQGWPRHSNNPQSLLMVSLVAFILATPDKECECCWNGGRLKYSPCGLAWSCMALKFTITDGKKQDIFSVLSVLINNCLQTLLKLWCSIHRCVWSAHALRTHCVRAFEIGSYCTSCLHYSHCIPVTLLPGVITILHYQIPGAYASKITGNLPVGAENVNFTATADQ